MATILFDFDSTLISIESLDFLLASCLDNQPDEIQRIEAITQQGMNGEIPFHRALQQRLDLCAPNRTQVDALAQTISQKLTTGMPEFITALQQQGHEIWIISGGLKPLILPVATVLNIPHDRVHAVDLCWDQTGAFTGIDMNNPFAHSKLDGARLLTQHWHTPTIIIGDGYTDYQLYAAGIADQFIPYTEHAQRAKILATHAPVARNVAELQQKISL